MSTLKKNLVILSSFFLITALAYSESNEKVIYKYKKYEKFDLGDMSIKGDVITPGDISVKKRQFKRFNEGLFKRLHFKDKIKEDIRDLR